MSSKAIILPSQNGFMTFHYRILLVDDDPALRQTGAAVLASNGYEVQTAEGGFDALAQLRQSLGCDHLRFTHAEHERL